MSFEQAKNWEPKEWEGYAHDLLRARHGDENYIQIPDNHTGDSGIEGYSLSGNAYQSFAPDELCKHGELAQKQKNKIRDDIKKFIGNKAKLSKLIYGTKIKRWILVVPRQVSQEVIIYANQKAEEVRLAGLPYVDSDSFMVLVWDRTSFKVEELKLIEQGIHKLKIDPADVTETQLLQFESGKLELVTNITKKLAKLPMANDEKVSASKNELIKRFIMSENILQHLQEEYPQHYEKVITLRLKRENDLKLEALSNEFPSLTEEQKKFLDNLDTGCQLHPESTGTIAWGTIADWLMRCPLDFN